MSDKKRLGATPHRIEYITAFLAINPNTGDEGVAGVQGKTGTIPLIGSDQVRIDLLREHARNIAELTGQTIREIKFTTRVEVGEIVPENKRVDPAITCPNCGMTSYHPQDIAQKYCGACHQFHEFMGG